MAPDAEPRSLTRADLVANWREGLGGACSQHLLTGIEVTIDQDSAHATLNEARHGATTSGSVVFARGGRMYCRLLRTQTGWRITALRVVPIWREGDPAAVLGRWVAPNMDAPVAGSGERSLARDLSDLLYGTGATTLAETVERIVAPDFRQRIHGRVYDRHSYLPHVEPVRARTISGWLEIVSGSRVAGRYVFHSVGADGRANDVESFCSPSAPKTRDYVDSPSSSAPWKGQDDDLLR